MDQWLQLWGIFVANKRLDLPALYLYREKVRGSQDPDRLIKILVRSETVKCPTRVQIRPPLLR